MCCHLLVRQRLYTWLSLTQINSFAKLLWQAGQVVGYGPRSWQCIRREMPKSPQSRGVRLLAHHRHVCTYWFCEFGLEVDDQKLLVTLRLPCALRRHHLLKRRVELGCIKRKRTYYNPHILIFSLKFWLGYVFNYFKPKFSFGLSSSRWWKRTVNLEWRVKCWVPN